ncbi:protoheme IX farnesyltransferase [Schizosaccharomyces osmophilus]|uniref:Protoheme IX farnesyltransferase, mitochondrial n=1 Tax=Schizosaccharomyces osmophilus TaxID=2545709 RepID=A0AAE9WDF5_9SCHI|nr:protoheme IX farnesyltransferase [Schizosaccharomyces osmophilus]WBW73885.1 protoheme IX farnesyltransferase [Schizosaccharomyces osmophilus]
MLNSFSHWPYKSCFSARSSWRRFFSQNVVPIRPLSRSFFFKKNYRYNSVPFSPPSSPDPQVLNFLQKRIQSAPRFPKPSALLELGKPRLTILVVLTTMSSYALAPYPGLSFGTLVWLTMGTALCSVSANAFNQCMEPTLDCQMARTRGRPIPRGAVRPEYGWLFASTTGILGSSMSFLVNPTVGWLGLANIVLYMGVYTPLKRISILNTWVGSIVGALPPLMGWAACSGGDLSHAGAFFTAAILFAWQFPHFNAFSTMVADDYKRCGYQMASWKRPALNARVALRYSLLFLPLSYGFVWSGIVNPSYMVGASAANLYLIAKAWQFYRNPYKTNARSLFFASLLHLPLIFILTLGSHMFKVWKDSERIEPDNSSSGD